ncbi:hypothetical protein Tco_1116049, partial [Tanacetum coccineum]
KNRRDLPRDIPLDSVVVLRYEKRSKSENKGKVPTEMELVLEQTQQGTSYEVSVRAEGVEELKRKVKIKGEKKEALLTLRQKSEHQSDTQVITVKMEILLEPTSNKLMVGDTLIDFQIDFSVQSVLSALRRSGTPDDCDEVLKLKNLKKDALLKLFKLTYQEMYEHVSLKVTSSQDGEKRLCLADDLKKFKITYSHTSQAKGISSSLKSMITTPYSQEKEKEKEISGDGIGGGDGVLKAKSSGVIGDRVNVMSIVIDDEDVSLVDGALDGALGTFGDISYCFGEGVLSSSFVR